MFNLEKEKKVQPLRASVLIDGKPSSMEVDTGAALSVVSEETWKKLGKDRELEFSDVILRTYSGEVIQVLGKQTVDVQYKRPKLRSTNLYRCWVWSSIVWS